MADPPKKSPPVTRPPSAPSVGGSLLEGLDRSVDALTRARRMQERCARVGFDWNEAAGAREKLAEELSELDAAMEQRNEAAILSEMGDVILAATNVARLLGVDVEEALHCALDRFQERFAKIEQTLERSGLRPEQVDLETLEALWQQAKIQD